VSARLRQIEERRQKSTADVRAVAIGLLEHDPEKWRPVFRKDHAPSKS
jgi:hypothetical protein